MVISICTILDVETVKLFKVIVTGSGISNSGNGASWSPIQFFPLNLPLPSSRTAFPNAPLLSLTQVLANFLKNSLVSKVRILGFSDHTVFQKPLNSNTVAQKRHRQHVSEYVVLCSIKTLFTKTGSRLDWSEDCSLWTPASNQKTMNVWLFLSGSQRFCKRCPFLLCGNIKASWNWNHISNKNHDLREQNWVLKNLTTKQIKLSPLICFSVTIYRLNQMTSYYTTTC